MKPKKQIQELTAQAENDFGAAEALRKAGYPAHALFWLHLVLEKLCKAIWVKHNRNADYSVQFHHVVGG